MTQKKNYAYCRVSSSHQDYTHQVESIQTYCNANNIILERIISDDGISAYSTDMSDREGLMEVLQLSSQGKIDTLYIFETSRISRRHLQSMIIINELSKANVKIFSITEGLINDNSDISTLLQSIKAWNNEQESRKMSERIKSSKNLIAKNNGFVGGTTLYGYTKANGKLVVDEDKREIIKQMFNIYYNQGSKATMEYLKANGYDISTRSVLLQLLTNTTYKGYYYKSEDNKDIYIKELDIVGELFDKVQMEIKNRSTQNNKQAMTNKTSYIGEGLLFCSDCGKKFYINTCQNGSSNSYRANCNCLSQKNFTIKKMDNIINEEVSNWYSSLDTDILKDKFQSHRELEYKKLLVREKQLSSLLHTKETTLTNANKKLEQSILLDVGIDTIKILSESIAELKKGIEKLKEQIQEINSEIEQEQILMQKDIEVSEKLLNYSFLYTKANEIEKKMLVRAIVEKINITNWSDIEIVWKY